MPTPKLSALLRGAHVRKDALLTALRDIRGSQRVTDQNPEDQYQALEKYAKDLTELARQGKLIPSSDETARFAAQSRFSPGARKTIL